MTRAVRISIALVGAIVAVVAMCQTSAFAQANPYREVQNWAKAPAGRKLGSVSGVGIDSHGNIWVVDRCGTSAHVGGKRGAGLSYSCVGSNVEPILKFDPSGRLLKSYGRGMFGFPHGLHVDDDDNVWVTDLYHYQVLKLSPDGKVLLTLGKARVAGTGPDTFNAPTATVIAPNGDIFVADGHGGLVGDTNARIVKFSKDGQYLKSWGKKGSASGDFGMPHDLAMDSKGRLFVTDRTNNRISIFDQDGKLLEEWKQFGRPSNIFIDAQDTIYVSDAHSDEELNPGFKQGIRIGSSKDGVVRFHIPPVELLDKSISKTEPLVVDANGNIYAGEGPTMNLRKYAKN